MNAPSGLHAGMIERARPFTPRSVDIVALLRPAVPPVRSRLAKSLPTRPRRHALTVRVEPDLRALLVAEKARLGTTAQAILHRALSEHLGR